MRPSIFNSWIKSLSLFVLTPFVISVWTLNRKMFLFVPIRLLLSLIWLKWLEVISCHHPVAVVRTINSPRRRHLQGFHVRRLWHSRATLLPPRTNYEDKSDIISFVWKSHLWHQSRRSNKMQPQESERRIKTAKTPSLLLSTLYALNVNLKNIAQVSNLEKVECSDTRAMFCVGKICKATLHINSHVLQGQTEQFSIRDFASRSLWQIGCIMGNATNSSMSLVCTKRARSKSQVAHFVGEHTGGGGVSGMPVICCFWRWAEFQQDHKFFSSENH